MSIAATEQPHQTQQEIKREEILQEIVSLEARLSALRDLLPPTFKKFFVFITDKRRIWVYADSRETAEKKLHARMNRDYGSHGWQVTSQTVAVYNDPIDAANHTPGNLCNSLSRPDALEFMEDYRRNQAGRPEQGTAGVLDRDVKSYDMQLRLDANLR